MSDSLLVEALHDTRGLLADLEDDDDDATTALRERVEVLARASAAVQLRPARRDQLVHLAKLALALRDEAVSLRCRHRSMQQLIHQMMD